MAAYSLGDRFSPPPKCNRLFDPGAYDKYAVGVKQNKVPFLQKSPRITGFGATIWNHSLYNADIRSKIPNCTSLMSKIPRFPYEAFSEKDLEELICRCGFQTCECPVEDEEQEEEITCQAKVRKRIYKGPAPRSRIGGGLSAPSKRDRGFQINPDGSQKRLIDYAKEESPPFYEARVNEATAYYRGCKWSKWTSQRAIKSLDVVPGPADYTFEREPTDYERCVQKLRSTRRKASKQLRFIEIIQQRDILEGCPGPASYSPSLPKGTELLSYGPKSERFPVPKYDVCPGPTTYSTKRDFEPPTPPEYPCHARLPEPACFGIKAARFKTKREEGPGPASYGVHYKPCQFMKCGASSAPFGCSAVRFKNEPIESEDSDEFIEDELEEQKKICLPLTWQFKSKTIRMKSDTEQFDEPNNFDKPNIFIPRSKVDRGPLLQYLAPFNSSEGRFQPWCNDSPVYAKLNTPGPGYYSLEKPKCQPAVNRGPLHRAPRFVDNRFMTPAPNEYNIDRGIETVLDTHNKRLKNNIGNKHKFHWVSTEAKEPKTIEAQETELLCKCIALCDPDYDSHHEKQEARQVEEKKPAKDANEGSGKDSPNPKLLRCFLYKQSMPYYY